MTSIQASAADVFGTATPNVQATNELRDRMVNLEREIAELKKARAAEPVLSSPTTPVSSPSAGAPVDGSRPGDVRPRPIRKVVDPFAHLNKCFTGLPNEGAEPSEIQMVHKQMKHEVVGTVNGKKLVRDLETSAVMAMSDKDFKEFEVQRCLAIVRKIKNDAALSVTPTGPGTPPPIPPTPMPVPKPGSAAPAAAAPAAPAAPAKPAESKAPGAK